jgi:hypothetical protein
MTPSNKSMWCVVDFALRQQSTQSLNLGDAQRNPARSPAASGRAFSSSRSVGLIMSRVVSSTRHLLSPSRALCGRIDFCDRTSHANEECLDTAGAAVSRVARVIRQFRSNGELTPEVGEPTPNGYLVEVACTCAVTYDRWVTPEDAAVDLALEHLQAGN